MRFRSVIQKQKVIVMLVCRGNYKDIISFIFNKTKKEKKNQKQFGIIQTWSENIQIQYLFISNKSNARNRLEYSKRGRLKQECCSVIRLCVQIICFKRVIFEFLEILLYIISDNMRFSYVQNKNYDASILKRIYRYNIFLFPIRVMLEIDWSILNVVIQSRNVVRLSIWVTKLFVLKRVILELFEIIQQIIQCGDIIVGELFVSLCDDIISCLDYTSNVVLTQNQVLPDVRHTKLTV
eukprot:TRINITY_DN6222_c0_g1_i1.p2 TRINITY_DN6222_c0_g1~~TRINITY_DN6222_c0_g1_i1.p2  ORF type:complete len:237 (-),score=-10.70 TRINITY_DN6222_c0_g1_i1:77-787(-)